MAVMIGDTGADRVFEVAPAGPQPAVCAHVYDMGMVNDGYGTQHRVALVFQLAAKDSNGRRFVVSRDYLASTNEKATLRKHLESWRTKAFTDDQVKQFNLSMLEGKPCLLSIVHAHGKKDPTKTYANINGIMRLPEGMTVSAPDNCQVPKFLVRKKAEAQGPTAGSEGFDEGEVGTDDMPF